LFLCRGGVGAEGGNQEGFLRRVDRETVDQRSITSKLFLNLALPAFLFVGARRIVCFSTFETVDDHSPAD